MTPVAVQSPKSSQPPQSPNRAKRWLLWPLRILWIILRSLFVPVLCVGGLVLGLAIGYSIIGKQPMDEVFVMDTWKHLFDLVFGD
jgi:hypothetical protein